MTEHGLDWSHTVDDWLRSFEARAYSRRTIDSYRHTLGLAIDVIGRDRDPRTLTLDDYERVLSSWSGRVQPNTLHNRAMALRSWDAWLAARRHGRGEARHLAAIRRNQIEMRRLADREVAAVVAAARTPRDRAVIALIGPLALRNHEARSLLVQDVDLEERIVVLPEGKGGRGRVVPLGPDTHRVLADHIGVLAEQGNAQRRHYLVCQRGEGFGVDDDREERLYPWRQLGPSALNRIVLRLCTAAGIDDPAAITPHSFRRWALETFIAETGDLHAAAELAGHADVNQTRRYAGRARLSRTRSGVAAIEAAVLNSRSAANRGVGAPGFEPGPLDSDSTAGDPTRGA